MILSAESQREIMTLKLRLADLVLERRLKEQEIAAQAYEFESLIRLIEKLSTHKEENTNVERIRTIREHISRPRHLASVSAEVTFD